VRTKAPVQTKPEPTTAESLSAGQTGLLQRKCACGGAGHDCEECKKKGQRTLQRRSAAAAGLNSVPPIVHDVLRSPGQSLDAATRSFMEPRFEHDFSHVRVHTDMRAASSARAVSALAYTVGRDVVFAEGQYSPEATEGKSCWRTNSRMSLSSRRLPTRRA
jgi:hypothetical protein